MKPNLIINLVPYRIISDGIDLHFSSENKTGQKIAKKWIPSEFRENVPYDEAENTYWSFENLPNSITVNFEFFKQTVDDKNHRYFLKRIFTQLLYKHFQRHGFIIGRSYIGDVRIWIPTPIQQPLNNNYEIFDKYSVRVDVDAFGKNSGVFISYDGQSFISRQPLEQIDLRDPNLIGKIICNNHVYSKNDDDFPIDINQCRIVYNKKIEDALGIKLVKRRLQNKYLDYYNKVNDFYKQYLSGKPIGECFEVLTGGFVQVPDFDVSFVDEECNLLEFKNHVRNVNVYDGLKQAGGPYDAPLLNDLQFLFIFMERDKEVANKLFSFLNKGLKNFPGLEKYVSVPFNVDSLLSLQLKNEQDIVREVREWLENGKFDPTKKYFVIYVSPISKDDEDANQKKVYYKIKEELLKREISSQVVFKDNLEQEAFNFYLPNIAVAILAKLGGIPWRLPYPLKKDLVVGIGAYRNAETNDTLLGTAICFRNDGQFQEFKVFPAEDIDQLGNSLKESILNFVKTSGECSRLIIHYYKALGPKERNILDKVMKQLDVDVPYFFVTVNDTESRDYVVFDDSFDGRMPVSGTFVRLRFNEFLLCNNTRYESYTGQKLLGYPFPVKVKVRSQPTDLSKDFGKVKEILNQVYEFSRIYWKSIRQRNKPVTIEYSEIIAKVVSQFDNKKLPQSQIASKSLWFL